MMNPYVFRGGGKKGPLTSTVLQNFEREILSIRILFREAGEFFVLSIQY